MSDFGPAIFHLKVIPEGEKGQPVNLIDVATSFTYEDNEKKADKCEIVLDNRDLRFFDDPTFRKGSLLEVSWGYPGQMALAERLVIVSLKGSNEDFRIEALHSSHNLTSKKRSRTYSNMTRSEVAAAVANDWGYDPSKQVIDDTKIRFPIIGQGGRADSDFIRYLAAKEGFEFFIDASGFHFHKRRVEQAPIKAISYYTDETGEIQSFDIESDSTGRKGKVVVKGRDPDKKENFSAEGSNTATKRDSLGQYIELVDEQTGQTKVARNMASEDVIPTAQTSAAAAKRLADGKYTRNQMGNFVLRATLIGDPAIRAKKTIQIDGLGQKHSGIWYIRKATHVIQPGSYETRIECVRDAHNGYKGPKKDPETSGAVNKKKPNDEPQAFEKVDSATGQTKVTWR